MQINNTWQSAFKQELLENLRRISNDFTRQLYIIDLTTECVWYSCDMCLHYYKEGAFHGITSETIDNISYNVCVAMHSIVNQFNESCWEEVQDKVRTLMKDPRTYSVLQEEVNNYYRS